MLAEGQFQGQTNEALGTPHYMAPEQFLMNGQPSSATDIYALGLIAYMILVGKPYRLEESTKVSSVVVFAVEAVKGPRESPVIRASRHDVTLPDAFDAWFFCVAAPNPSERFTTATEAVTALAVVLDVPLPDETSLVGVMGPSSRNAFGSASDLASSRSVSVTVSGSIPSTLSEPTLLDTTSPAKASDAFRRSFTPIALSILVALGVGTFVSYKVFYRPPPDEPVASQVDSMSIPSASVPQVRPVVAADSVAVEPQAPPFNSWFGSAPASAAPMSEASVATTKSAVRSKDKPNSTRSATVKKAGRRGLWSND
jgi:serine/threonine-protein kinase